MKNKLEELLLIAKTNGKKYSIFVSNMGTTLFGSVDNPETFTALLKKLQLSYRLHKDGAYDGFAYPFNNQDSVINFSNPKISSITIDAHKMLQAPYGTGILFVEKI
jgi:glutamate/tyrosine decarboxylase-like PLP-dependent enzyme